MSKMTALDDYLARQRETLRAATPRPWTMLPGTDFDEALVCQPGDTRRAYTRIAECGQGNAARQDDADAQAIVSAVNDREALFDAVELLAELTRRVSTLLEKHEWDGWGPTSPNEIEEAYVGEFTSRARAVLSRLTADSEGVTHV